MRSADPSDLSAEPEAVQRLTPAEKERLTDILDRYLSALEDGAPPRREELLAAHPDLAGPLRVYLDHLDDLHEVAAGFCKPRFPSQAGGEMPDSDERRLGDFKLLREIGRGGMGIVYEAQQISLGRRVALKVLPFAAVLDSRQIARFQHEAKAAAQLLHPNIVSVFAVGVERGVHYYAMQLIDGQPLDRAIAELRKEAGPPSSDVPAELPDQSATGGAVAAVDACPSTCNSFLTEKSTNQQEYFRTVARLGIQAAEALHAAHEHGIVHRDIKPSNLLLDSDGKLWVTDFGLARCQNEAPLTHSGDVVGTVRYMSPEQARGHSALVDQRTDIYSLGITLYELLALRPAFSRTDGPALLRRIDQEEPPRLRQLQPKIPPDLETVVLKAIAKQREHRYTTAQEFAEDLRRFLDGKPTIARPPTPFERLGKWARRHKRIVAAAAAIGLFGVLGMAASTMVIAREKIKTEQNYQRAERNFREAQGAVDRFGAQLAERLADVPGADQVRRDLLRDTLKYYEDFVAQAKEDPVLRSDLALTYSKIGTLTGEIGSTEEALEAHENAIRLFGQLAADKPQEPDYRRRLAVAENNLALVLRRAGRTDRARRAYRDAIRLQKELADGAAGDQQDLGDLALSYSNLGLLQVETSESKEAEASFGEAIRLRERLLDGGPDDPEHLRDLAAALNNLTTLYVNQDPARAAELYQKALAYQTKAAAVGRGDLKYRSDVALTYNNLGAAQSRAGQLAEAAASYLKAIDIQRDLARLAPAQKSYRHDLAVSFNNLGMTQSKRQQTADAEQSFRQGLELEGPLAEQNPDDVELQSSLGGMFNNLGVALEELQRAKDAAKSYRKAIMHQQQARAHAPTVARYRDFLSNHYYNYGRVLRRLGRPDEAARVALARRGLWPNDGHRLFTVAEELALASGLCRRSKPTDMTAAQCAGYAIETLRQAAAAGWTPPPDLASAESFAALKNYPGFAALVRH